VARLTELQIIENDMQIAYCSQIIKLASNVEDEAFRNWLLKHVSEHLQQLARKAKGDD
jgi:hypothetical protein